MTASVSLLRESEATDDRLKDTFRDIKAAMRVSLVVEYFQAWAAVPRFLELVWRRLRPNVLSQGFIASAHALREVSERAIAAWPIGDHAAQLQARNVGRADVLRMTTIADMFSLVDHKGLILTHVVRRALEGEDVGGAGGTGPAAAGDREEADFRGLAVQLADERDAPVRVRSLFESIKRELGVAYLPSDVRAIGAFPDWLEVWWRECTTAAEQRHFATLSDELTERGLERAQAIPYRVRLGADILANYKIGDADRRRALDATRALCELMPRLCIVLSIAKRGLNQ